eukprot:2160838-Rhodomonas_salina.6
MAARCGTEMAYGCAVRGTGIAYGHPVLRYRMGGAARRGASSLRRRAGMSGTGIAYGVAMSGTGIAYGDAMSGTGIAYSAGGEGYSLSGTDIGYTTTTMLMAIWPDHAMRGTETGYAPTGETAADRSHYAGPLPITRRAPGISLRAAYAMSGTGVASGTIGLRAAY